MCVCDLVGNIGHMISPRSHKGGGRGGLVEIETVSKKNVVGQNLWCKGIRHGEDAYQPSPIHMLSSSRVTLFLSVISASGAVSTVIPS